MNSGGGYCHQHVTVNRSQDHSTGTLLNSGSVLVVILCPQEKGTGAFKKTRKFTFYHLNKHKINNNSSN